ncbi:unnamed protein product, partial [Laminaria digitata]
MEPPKWGPKKHPREENAANTMETPLVPGDPPPSRGSSDPSPAGRLSTPPARDTGLNIPRVHADAEYFKYLAQYFCLHDSFNDSPTPCQRCRGNVWSIRGVYDERSAVSYIRAYLRHGDRPQY